MGVGNDGEPIELTKGLVISEWLKIKNKNKEGFLKNPSFKVYFI